MTESAESARRAFWRGHFPQDHIAADRWTPVTQHRALSARVLAVARSRIEGAWAAYIDAVPGVRHEDEVDLVLDHGAKLDVAIAREMFPFFADLPYAD